MGVETMELTAIIKVNPKTKASISSTFKITSDKFVQEIDCSKNVIFTNWAVPGQTSGTYEWEVTTSGFKGVVVPDVSIRIDDVYGTSYKK